MSEGFSDHRHHHHHPPARRSSDAVDHGTCSLTTPQRVIDDAAMCRVVCVVKLWPDSSKAWFQIFKIQTWRSDGGSWWLGWWRSLMVCYFRFLLFPRRHLASQLHTWTFKSTWICFVAHGIYILVSKIHIKKLYTTIDSRTSLCLNWHSVSVCHHPYRVHGDGLYVWDLGWRQHMTQYVSETLQSRPFARNRPLMSAVWLEASDAKHSRSRLMWRVKPCVTMHAGRNVIRRHPRSPTTAFQIQYFTKYRPGVIPCRKFNLEESLQSVYESLLLIYWWFDCLQHGRRRHNLQS